MEFQRHNINVLICLLILIFVVACSSSQEKTASDSTGDIPAMNVAGTYDFHCIVKESNVPYTGLFNGESIRLPMNIKQSGTKLKWSQFAIGKQVYNGVKSDFKGNTAEFVDKSLFMYHRQLKYNATIVFTENGFTGSGDFTIEDDAGKFTITGTRIE